MRLDPILVDRLRAHGLRVTAPRVAVLAVLEGEGHHADALSIAEMARRQCGNLSIQAVYDNLNALVDAGLVRRIQPSGHTARYEPQRHDNHHHIVCRHCGATEDVACAVGHVPCLEPVHDHGYVVDEAEVIYWGLCPRCQGPDPNPIQEKPKP
jgi:Fe2+ or Zn2+ uptake regulation protein